MDDKYLQALNAIGVGKGGTLGSPLGLIVLSTTPTLLISNIGGAYTGDGANSGHQLIYSFSINDYGLVNEAINEIIVVTYTISN